MATRETTEIAPWVKRVLTAASKLIVEERKVVRVVQRRTCIELPGRTATMEVVAEPPDVDAAVAAALVATYSGCRWVQTLSGVPVMSARGFDIGELFEAYVDVVRSMGFRLDARSATEAVFSRPRDPHGSR